MSSQTMIVYLRDGTRLELGRADAITLIQSGQATEQPWVETAADNRNIETASEPAPAPAKKAPTKKAPTKKRASKKG